MSVCRCAGLRAFLNDVLQHHFVQAQIRDQFLEFAVFIFQLAQPTQLGYAQTAAFFFQL